MKESQSQNEKEKVVEIGEEVAVYISEIFPGSDNTNVGVVTVGSIPKTGTRTDNWPSPHLRVWFKGYPRPVIGVNILRRVRNNGRYARWVVVKEEKKDVVE